MSAEDSDAAIWQRIVLAIVMVLIIGVSISWCAQGNDFFLYKFFAPRQEAVRRQVFEETKSYNQGMQQEILAMQMEYVQAKPEQQAALASIILHRTADYDLDRLQPDTKEFIISLRKKQTEVGK